MNAAAVLCCLVFAVLQSSASRPRPPFDLRCEGNPVGLTRAQMQDLSARSLFAIDASNPRLSWTLEHSDRGAQQAAYAVIVSYDTRLASLVWDSGKLFGRSTELRYSGPRLESGTLYFWKVHWWDLQGREAESEETGHFMTGVLDPNDWYLAKWIAAPSNIAHAPLISKTFAVDNTTVKEATLYISGLGFFKVSVNGVDLNSKYDPPIALNPGWTNYEVRVPYSVYDITQEMKLVSEASVDVILGIGWRNTSVYPLKDPSPPKPDSVERVLRVILNVTYTDGGTLSVMSDDSWSCSQSPFTYDSIYNGETYDARMAPRKTSTVKATITNGPTGGMNLSPIPYITAFGEDKAIRIYRLDSDPSKQIVDFGNNSAGVCRINVKDLPSGSSIKIRHAEVLMHPPYGSTDGSLYYGNLRSALQTDIYTSDGKAATYQPSLTYHGFRYAEVSGYPRNLATSDITKIVINSDMKINGRLNTSSALLNSIQENVKRGQLSNLMSVITDCNQRDERLGWMGDAGLSADSMALNFHMEAFHPFSAQLMADDQINGSLPDVVPFYRYGSRPADPSWGAAFPQVLWTLYKYYGDIDTARRFYPYLLDYINSMVSTARQQGIGKFYGYYGDWVPPPPNPKVSVSFTSAFSLLTNIREAVEIAMAIGDKDTAAELTKTFGELASDFNSAFLNGSVYLNGLQITYVLPLSLGIVPSDIREHFELAFLNQLRGPDHTHITAGIIGTKFILPVLSNIKQQAVAMEIVQQMDYPSWGFMIHNPFEPATAVWELWNGHNGSAGMDSRNHHMFSSVSGWMMTDMVGLNQPEGSYGFQEVHFHPARTLDLSRASVRLEHPKPLLLRWERTGGIQCSKAAENQSPLNPNLPRHSGLTLACGEESSISEVLFASYGNPSGSCGRYRVGSCHHKDSLSIVEELCLGRSSCHVPTGGDFWGEICPEASKWLSVAVQCCSWGAKEPEYKFHHLRADVTVPVGSVGALWLPAHGKRAVRVWEGEELVWSKGVLVGGVKGIVGSKWDTRDDALKLELVSGSYQFELRGENPQRKCVDSRQNDRFSPTILHCNSSDVITSIDWASYGHPETFGSCFSHRPGECDAGGSTLALERKCLGKQRCVVFAEDGFFGGTPCRDALPRHLVAVYTCSDRH